MSGEDKISKENTKNSIINSPTSHNRILSDTNVETNDNMEWNTIKEDKTHNIEIKIKKINQLFNSLDPSPFLEKKLDDDAFEYIVSSVFEQPLKRKQKITIHIPKSEKKKISELEIKRSIRNFFEYKKMIADKDIKLKLKEGQLSFLVGITFLVICLAIGQYVMSISKNTWAFIAFEGLLIGGWVAMWKPISDLLYEWWPTYKEKKIYHKISEMEINFIYT